MKSLFLLIMAFVMFCFLPSCNPNEYAPELADQIFYLDENSPAGTSLGTIEANDRDEGQQLHFEIIHGDEEEVFALDARSGVLSVRVDSMINFEKVESYDLLIEVCDQAENNPLCNSANVRILINDLNEFAPVVKDQNFNVPEGSPQGMIIGKLIASDRDPGQELSFQIISGNEEGAISLDSTTGTMFIQDSSWFNYDIHQELICQFSVNDNDSQAPLKSTASVRISVEDKFAEYNISGTAQKGPFVLGSQILISELDSDLVPTGRTFSTQTQDNSGIFTLNGVELASNFVLVRVDGFYYNEISGELSESQLSLSGIMDLSQADLQNLNILTHLEQYRLQYLVEQGTSFASAKSQAHDEVMQMFEFSTMEISRSELLDISEQGEDHAMLLAASVILQGKRTTAELSELINLIGSDIREDGRLDNPDLGSQLINDASILKLAEIRNNIEQRYEDLGMVRAIADFEKYLQWFIEHTAFKPNNEITFPEIGTYGTNALHSSVTQVENERITGRLYSFAVQVPKNRSFMVRTSGGLCLYRVGTEINMKNYAEWEPDRFSTYTTTASGLCDVTMLFQNVNGFPTTILLEFFEDGNTEPFLTKELEVVDGVVPEN